ncbi:MAG: HAMP domain-containing protein [Calditrichaeota bacterium]|nr:HAMP domain-containing protein [Calditrichota bacterium]
MQTGQLKWLRFIQHSLGLRLLVIFSVVILGLLLFYAQLYLSFSRDILEETVRVSAYRGGDLVQKALYNFMLENDRANLAEIITNIGNEPGVQRIRIYNKDGIIKFSNNSAELGNQVDMQAEACFACHSKENPSRVLPVEDQSRIFRSASGQRVLGLIIPVYNEASCYRAPCHAHPETQSVLGVLDVQMSLAELDAAIANQRRYVYGISLVFLVGGFILIGLIIYFSIDRPIRTLITGTERLGAGELSHRIPLSRSDELGVLARSFNSMAQNLEEAYRELKNWSQMLEQRVQEKTQELEAIHQEIVRVERMASLGKMAATVAHELNNPLSGIVNYARLLERQIRRAWPEDVPLDPAIWEELAFIRNEALRCGEIVKNLLVFARGSRMNIQTCHLSEIIDRALKLVRHHLELAKVRTRVQLSLTSDKLECDPDQILQVLVALMVNAIEAMPRGGELTVEAHHPDRVPQKLLLMVRDTGVGIPESIRDKIFEPFVSTKQDGRGVGLGLAVVYGIVQRHHGRIWVTSREGQGTTFFIELPLSQSNRESSFKSEGDQP